MASGEKTRNSDLAEEENIVTQVTVVFLVRVYPRRWMFPEYFLFHLYRRDFQRARISYKVRQVFLLLPTKRTNSVFILWKGARSSSFTCRPILSRFVECDLATTNACLKSTVFSGAHSHHMSHYMRHRSLHKEFIKHSDYALPDNALLLEQGSNASAMRET